MWFGWFGVTILLSGYVAVSLSDSSTKSWFYKVFYGYLVPGKAGLYVLRYEWFYQVLVIEVNHELQNLQRNFGVALNLVLWIHPIVKLQDHLLHLVDW